MLLLWMRCLLFISLTLWPFAGKSPEIKKSSRDLPPTTESFEYVRISLGGQFDNFQLSTGSPFKILGLHGKVLMQGPSLQKVTVSGSQNGFKIGQNYFTESPVTLVSMGDGFEINRRHYRDALVIWRNKDATLSLVNQIFIEDYLKGVLPWEVNPKWTREVLEAQAIASRTYAIFKVLENKGARYDMSHDILSQVYGGKTSENPVTTQAVDATRGQILTYHGQVFPAYFHSTCGGGTARAHKIWDIVPHPALQGTVCHFCEMSKHYRWKENFDLEEIAGILRQHGWDINSVTDVRMGDVDAFGRAETFEIVTDQGKRKIRANDFRLWLGPGRMKSTLITRSWREGNLLHFSGRGWGHGAGMCQYGAKGLSDLGYKHKQILKYYYPGSEIKTLTWDL